MKRQTKRKLKELSVNVGLPTRQCVQEATKSMTDEDRFCLPDESSMKRMVQRARAKEDIPTNPKERTGFVIEGKYAQYCEEPFLQYDSGVDDPDRILIFMTESGKKDLENYGHWSADGTFKVCPVIFYQLYMVHVHINEFQTVPR